jgi:hypothetical protein
MTFILTFSLLSILLLVGLVAYLCPPTTSARSRSFLAQQEEWLYLRRFPLPKEVILLNFNLFRIGALAEGQHALIVEDDSTTDLVLFDYVTVEDTFGKQTVILVKSKSLDSFILKAQPFLDVELSSDSLTLEKQQGLESIDTRCSGYRIETNQGFRAKGCLESLEQFIDSHPGISIEYVGNTLLVYKPNVCLSQEQLDQAISLARRLFCLLSR